MSRIPAGLGSPQVSNSKEKKKEKRDDVLFSIFYTWVTWKYREILWRGLDTGDRKFSHNEVLFLGLKPSLHFMSERKVSSWFAYPLCQSIEGN